MNKPTERLFFAIWPDEITRVVINTLSQQTISGIKGRPTRPENIHITLAFLGEVDKTTKQCMQQVAATIQAPRFTLTLDQIGYWQKPQILWLGTTNMPDSLKHLVKQLNHNLKECNHQPESRPYQVHMTLMRKVAAMKTIPPIIPLLWTATDFCLVRSLKDRDKTIYQIEQRWQLIDL